MQAVTPFALQRFLLTPFPKSLADDSQPEAYSHPIIKDLIIKTIFLTGGVGRSYGLVDACSAKLGDDNMFNPIPMPTVALAATAVMYFLLIPVVTSSDIAMTGVLCSEGVAGRHTL